MSQSNYDLVKSKIYDFSLKYPRPGLDIKLEELSPIKTDKMWQNADRAGIYFLFDENKILQYIGKASFGSSIGMRIGVRFSSKDCRCLNPKFQTVTMLATIPLPDERIFEASSIEEFLIRELRPPLNVVGVY